MIHDSEIGRVVAVDTAQVSIELNRDLKGMVRNTYEGSQEIGCINSYVIIPVGARRLLAMVTRVALVEEAELRADRTTVSLPAARRLMKATLIGTIDGPSFSQGVSVFPVLDSSVQLARQADLNAVFGPIGHDRNGPADTKKPGYCIHIGESAVVRERPIRINPDAFFGKHAAIIGSTGSGKSCTIASLLQSVQERPDVRRTTFLILDTNGEYRAAFKRSRSNGSREQAGPKRTLYIPSDPMRTAERLVIPYWFMNSEDFIRIFQAAKGVQRPMLLEALRLARNDSLEASQLSRIHNDLVLDLNRIWALLSKDEKTSKDVRDLAKGLKIYIREKSTDWIWSQMASRFGLQKDDMIQALKTVLKVASQCIDQGKYPKVIPADARKKIQDAIEPIFRNLTGSHPGNYADVSGRSADAPSHFDKQKFRSRHMEQVLRGEAARVRDYASTMLLRVDRLLADQRFDFLFGPVGTPLPNPAHALATFLRDTIGLGAAENVDLSPVDSVPKSSLPFYDRQRGKGGSADVVILDLSLLTAEVLENVTALIGRLVLEFLQRIGEHGGKDARGSLPVVIVLEEAHNYIRHGRFDEEESIARVVFERIAREGRKYGLGLVVASQRPSELSRTVLSQCSSFVVHRLQNPEDLRYFREIVPGIYGPLLDQVPALAPQTALVLGECVAAPALVKIREARPVPRSRDPLFYNYWAGERAPAVDVEGICAEWEGSGAGSDFYSGE